MPRDPMALLNKVIAAEQSVRGQEFLAPLLPRSKARLKIGGIVQELAVTVERAGWYICRALDAKQAEIVEPAPIWAAGDYLKLLPQLRMVLLERLGDTSNWLAIAFNPSDASQRFQLAGPAVVHLVDGGQPFDRIVARMDGATLWFEDIDQRADVEIAERLRAALEARQIRPEVKNLAPGERAAYALLAQRQGIGAAPEPPPAPAPARRGQTTRPARRPAALPSLPSTEEWLRQSLRLSGRELVGYEVFGDEVTVHWRGRDGSRRPPLRISSTGDVISSGICLSGRDRDFDLASVVGIIDDSPSFARLYGDWYDDRDYDDD